MEETKTVEQSTDWIVRRYKELFGGQPKLFRAPGRVNLIGEHTDYNDGYVMPSAIEFFTWVAIAPRTDRKLRIYSEYFQQWQELSLDETTRRAERGWTDSIHGVAALLEKSGHGLLGADMYVYSTVPIGAGLSSSAALELSTGLALTANAGINVPLLEMVKIAQRAEHEYTGTKCGIMDQFIAAFGRAEHALMLDCRTLEYQLLRLPHDVRVVICDTGVKHELAGGEYNLRRAACEQGVKILQQDMPGIKALRDATPADIENHKDKFSDEVYRRCRHVVSEDERVLKSAEAIRRGDMEAFGKFMYASHASLRDDYEVSCKELDILVELAEQQEGVYGARMTGGGFGGCTVNLVSAEHADAFREKIAQEYKAKTGLDARTYLGSAADGAKAVPLP